MNSGDINICLSRTLDTSKCFPPFPWNSRYQGWPVHVFSHDHCHSVTFCVNAVTEFSPLRIESKRRDKVGIER